ncbi:MAG: DUF1501 domain-containing protein [Betaproteobacteria bacterium]
MDRSDRFDSRRRRLLAAAGGLTAAGLLPRLASLALPSAYAQTATDYKALVCVFLYGGNDGNDTIVPIDDYAQYANVRGRSGAAIGEGELAPLLSAAPGRRYGLHPELRDLAPLFAAKKLAVVCNVGTLAAPLTRAQYLAGTGRAPRNLFSHSDQQLQWQGLVPGALATTGWGGRVADARNAGNMVFGIPGVISLAGDALFSIGATSIPLALPGDGSNGLVGDLESPSGRLRYDAMKRLLQVERDSTIVARAADVMSLALASAEKINAVFNGEVAAVDTAFRGVNSGLAQQLSRVATLIAGRFELGVSRQIFFCAMGGFDTHASQRSEHGDRMRELGTALAAFQRATEALGVSPQVTAFTLSDFGRTLRVNANAGTDHAWGSHHLVLGGAVKGGTLYGRFPTLALAGPDDAGDEGQWIPTTALDQYGATLASWFGVPAAALSQVFPRIQAFATPTLGFA